MMICTNALVGAPVKPVTVIRTLLVVLNPFAPHLTEELWARLGGETLVADEPWPSFDPALLVEDEVEMPVQINGKVREKIVVPTAATAAEIERAALAVPKIAELLAALTIKKVVVVPKRLVNIVAV